MNAHEEFICRLRTPLAEYEKNQSANKRYTSDVCEQIDFESLFEFDDEDFDEW